MSRIYFYYIQFLCQAFFNDNSFFTILCKMCDNNPCILGEINGIPFNTLNEFADLGISRNKNSVYHLITPSQSCANVTRTDRLITEFIIRAWGVCTLDYFSIVNSARCELCMVFTYGTKSRNQTV